MSIDLEAVRQMARDVMADKDGLTEFDRDIIGYSSVRVNLPLRDTVAMAKHLAILSEAIHQARAILSYRTKNERSSILTVRGLLRQANQKINPYKRVRID